MKKGVRIWVRGLIAAFISGGANGVTAGFAAVGIAPETFNLDQGSTKTLLLAVAVAVIGAVTGTAAYLKQSPIPPDETELELPRAA